MKIRTAAVLLFLFILLPICAENRSDDRNALFENQDFKFWYELIGADEKTVISAVESRGFGIEWIGINPRELGSRVDRIRYINGLTVWFIGAGSAGKAVQLRFDSALKGTAAGLGIGISPAEVRRICGTPWIEAEGSLYYNLPWRGAPVRLRFVFQKTGTGNSELNEVYLYQVR